MRGIFFDLDDTLIGYDEAERIALSSACAFASRLDSRIDEDSFSRALHSVYTDHYEYGTPGYARLKTLPVRELRRAMTSEALVRLGITDTSFCDVLIDNYEATEAEALKRFPDTIETLTTLRPLVRMGIITNGPSAMQRAKLAALELAGWFDEIVVDTEFGHPKPDARIFVHAAERIGLSSEELLFVGNSIEADIAGSNAAGWISVWINQTGARMPDAASLRPKYTIRTLSDLLSLPPVAALLK